MVNFLLTLVQRCLLLGKIDARLEFVDCRDEYIRSLEYGYDYDDYEGTEFNELLTAMYMLKNRSTKLSYTLKCSTAKPRTQFGTIAAGESVRTIIPKLWPGMLKNATRPFGRYKSWN